MFVVTAHISSILLSLLFYVPKWKCLEFVCSEPGGLVLTISELAAVSTKSNPYVVVHSNLGGPPEWPRGPKQTLSSLLPWAGAVLHAQHLHVLQFDLDGAASPVKLWAAPERG